MITKRLHILGALCALALCAILPSCLKDDIPYPHIQPNILAIEAVGESRGAVIDSINRTVTFYFPEEVDIYNVHIASYALTPGAEVVDSVLNKPLDLSSPAEVSLFMYYDWTWTLSAIQTIDRYLEVEGQIGTPTIDVPAQRVVATVSEAQDIANLLVKDIKLGPEGSTMSPDLKGRYVDFTHPVQVVVTSHGRRQVWTIYVEQTESTIFTERVDVGSQVAWVYCSGEASANNGAEYRLAGDQLWTPVPEQWITRDGGSYCARLVHLSPGTAYQVRATSDTEVGAVLDFTTGPLLQLPNMDFDSWWLDGKLWCPWAQGTEPYWGTGNKGATTLGDSNTTPTEETVSGTGYAASLLTKFVGIASIGKLAAGNIFVGSYVATDGTNGILSFGRPYELRPTKLAGYLKYNQKPISHTNKTAEMNAMLGQPDTAVVWISLIDTPQPFEIRTNPKNRQLFDPNGSYVVAYGAVQYSTEMDAYIPFEIELKYNSTQRTPRYIIITASASKYGDYFTGGNGSLLLVDNLKLLYDY